MRGKEAVGAVRGVVARTSACRKVSASSKAEHCGYWETAEQLNLPHPSSACCPADPVDAQCGALLRRSAELCAWGSAACRAPL